MSTYPPRFFLRPEERVVVASVVAPAWALERMVAILLTALILWGGLGLVLALNRATGLAVWFSILAIVGSLHLLLGGLYVWRRVVTTEYVVTDEFVYARRGQILLQLGAAALDRVTDLHIHQGIVGRMFGYSTLRVLTAGGGLHMSGLRDAVGVRSRVQEARHSFIARLLREAGKDSVASAAPGRSCQCPRCGRVFRVVGALPMDVTCPQCQAAGTLFEEAVA